MGWDGRVAKSICISISLQSLCCCALKLQYDDGILSLDAGQIKTKKKDITDPQKSNFGICA